MQIDALHALRGAVRLAGRWLAGWAAPSRITVHVNSDFSLNSIFSHNNQLEQYFDLFFSPAEQAMSNSEVTVRNDNMALVQATGTHCVRMLRYVPFLGGRP